MRIQTKLVLVLIALVLVPVLLFSVFIMRLSINTAIENHVSYQINSMKKVGSAVESVFQELDRTTLFLIGDQRVRAYLAQDGSDPSATASSVYNVLGYLSNNSPIIKSIQVESNLGETLYRGSLPLSISPADRMRAAEDLGQPHWGVETDVNGVRYIYMCRLLRDTRDTRRHLGVVKIYLNLTEMHGFFQNEYDPSTVFYLFDEDGGLVSSSRAEDGSFPAAAALDTALLDAAEGVGFRWRQGSAQYYLSSYAAAANGWYVVSLSTSEAVAGQVMTSVVLLALLAGGCLAFCLILAILISRRVTKPVLRIAARMKELEAQDFSVRLQMKGDDEIAQLGHQFNRMAERIQSLVEKVYLVELRRKESELRALRAQMNPHFLYNTLDMVYWTAKMENAEVTSEQIETLSRFFRLALADKGDFSPVEEEIEHLRYYIVLRQQSGKEFEFDLAADPACLHCRVIKLALQPMVENAILHGIAGLEYGSIGVRIFTEGGVLFYTITDNGKGLDPAEMERLLYGPPQGTRGISVRNVNERIQLAWGEEYGLGFENLPGGGTRVTVRQPFIREVENCAQIDGCR